MSLRRLPLEDDSPRYAIHADAETCALAAPVDLARIGTNQRRPEDSREYCPDMWHHVIGHVDALVVAFLFTIANLATLIPPFHGECGRRPVQSPNHFSN